MICRLYLLALKKREKRREMLDRTVLESAKQTLEQKEEEILHALLPMGVDMLNKRQGKAGRAGGGGVPPTGGGGGGQ